MYIKLFISMMRIDVTECDLTIEVEGLIWIKSIEANPEFITAKISRAVVNNDKSKLTIGCMITEKWK